MHTPRGSLLHRAFSLPRTRCSYRARSCFSTAFSPSTPEPVAVAVGSNGSINLDIYHPPQSPSDINPVIIYLPRGPLPLNHAPEPSSLAALASSANTTVVRLNYRLAKNRKYPGPVHDVLAGYDWTAKHLVRNNSHQQVAGLRHGSIAVCGELIGGSLAAALALTECHSTKIGVKALAMGNPIADWTVMHHVLPPGGKEAQLSPPLDVGKKKRTARPGSWERNANDTNLSSSMLLRARSEFFKSPEDYFDPFASPTHFFRSPSVSVPGVVDPLDEIFLDIDISPQQETKKRRSHRRYPPPKSSLRLPDTRLMVGESSVLMDQAIDLAEGIARSNHSYGGPSGTGEGTGWERVNVEVKKGVGLWSETDLVELGAWFQERLRD